MRRGDSDWHITLTAPTTINSTRTSRRSKKNTPRCAHQGTLAKASTPRAAASAPPLPPLRRTLVSATHARKPSPPPTPGEKRTLAALLKNWAATATARLERAFERRSRRQRSDVFATRRRAVLAVRLAIEAVWREKLRTRSVLARPRLSLR